MALFRAIRWVRDGGRSAVRAKGLRVSLLELEVLAEPVRSASLATILEREEQQAGAVPVKCTMGAAAKRLRQRGAQLAMRPSYRS